MADALFSDLFPKRWKKAEEGAVLSSFFIGYALTQVPLPILRISRTLAVRLPQLDSSSPQVFGGSLADRFGGGKVLGAAVLSWSVATAFTPWAADLGLAPLLAMRVAMGAGEGPAFPSIHSMISRGVRAPPNTAIWDLVYGPRDCERKLLPSPLIENYAPASRTLRPSWAAGPPCREVDGRRVRHGGELRWVCGGACPVTGYYRLPGKPQATKRQTVEMLQG